MKRVIIALLLIGLCVSGVQAQAALLSSNTTKYDSNLVLLLHLNGTSGSTVFTDERGHIVTRVGNPTISTIFPKLGSGSGLFAGGVNGQQLSVAHSSDFEFGSGAVTWMWWENLTAVDNGGEPPFARDNSTVYSPWLLGYGQEAGHNKLRAIYMTSNGASWDIASGKKLGYGVDGVWTQYVVERASNGTFYTYQNGTQMDTWSSGAAFKSSTAPLSIGLARADPRGFHGELDEMAIWKGVAIPIADLYPMPFEINTTLLPVSSFAANVTSGVSPLHIAFNDTSTGAPTMWNVSFGTGEGWYNTTSFPATNITHIYSTPGNYTVDWYVSNSAGTGSASTTIVVTQPPFVADFISNSTGGIIPLAVLFTDSSVNTTALIDSWYWIFGDQGLGNTSSLQNPTHTYTTAGTYSANLTIRNTSYSLVSTKLATINANATIVADFAAAPTSGYATLSVSFVDMSSPSDIFSWYWDFGDGYTSTDRNPTHSYTMPGTYNVSLTATNPDGSNTETKIDYITVSQSEDINPDSTLKFKPDLNVISNQTRYNRTAQISNVTSANWVNASILFDTSTIFITNVFANTTLYPDNTLVSSNIDNDGGSITFNVTKLTPYNPGSSSASIVDIELFQKAYALGNTSNSWGGGVLGNSTYNTTHPVTYFDYTPLYYGEWKTYSNFTISNFHPIIQNESVTFTPIAPSGSTANRWLWNFGDGNSFLDLNGTPVSHMYTTYASNATLYPSLTAYLNENTSVTNTTTLTISPVYTNDHIVANFYGSPTTGSSGLLVTFTDSSMIGNRTNLIYNWTFGDGTYSSDSINVLHVYSSVGIYTVKLTVTNDYGTSTETKANYIVISNQQTTTFYIPKTTSFHVIDVYGNQIGGATLSATYNGSTLPDTTTSWLVSNYGMNAITSGEATNGALSMSGITSDTGDLTFVMIAPLEYDMYITYGGVTNHFFITTGSSNYQLKFVAPTVADTSLSKCVYANGNTHTGISSPDPYNMTLMWSYQDTCGLTTSIDYIVNDVDLGTTVYNYHLTPVTSGIYVNNYTVSNVRGKNYIWYENATRSV